MEKQMVCQEKEPIKRGEVTIDTLPDDMLLEIFSLYEEFYSFNLSWWRPLVHVCRRWRQTIFGSPLRLHLALVCNPRTSVRKSLNIWPPIPIAVHWMTWDMAGPVKSENVVAALGHRDRVSDIRFEFLTRSQLVDFTIKMADPFPALTYLSLRLTRHDELVLRDPFLGGSAPSLRTMILHRIAFPTLPNLLLSTTHLVTLRLSSVPFSGYISPEVMATCLAALPNLKQLDIEFQFWPVHTHSPWPTPALLPALLSFRFNGTSQYLEDLVARINAHALQTLSITFDDPGLHISQLLRFITRAKRPSPPNRAVVDFGSYEINLEFISSDSFDLAIIHDDSHRQVASIARVCQKLSPFLSRVERLDLRLSFYPYWQGMDPVLWLELFHPFIAVQSLYVSEKLEPLIASALQTLTSERATEVLPQLRTLFLKEPTGPVWEIIGTFVAARQLSDHPVAIEQCLTLDVDAKD